MRSSYISERNRRISDIQTYSLAQRHLCKSACGCFHHCQSWSSSSSRRTTQIHHYHLPENNLSFERHRIDGRRLDQYMKMFRREAPATIHRGKKECLINTIELVSFKRNERMKRRLSYYIRQHRKRYGHHHQCKQS